MTLVEPRLDGRLAVHFAEQSRFLGPGEALSFGREADLSIDNNPYLHRRLGEFRFHTYAWWLYNVGGALMLDVADSASFSRMSVAPGSAVPVVFKRSVIRFQAGSARYELELFLEAETPQPPLGSPIQVDDASATRAPAPSSIPLNRDQFRLLVALAEPRLRDRFAPRQTLPTNKAAAERLGWTMPKFNRKLDNLCTKLDKLGVVGLKGSVSGLASSRREMLVDYAIRANLVVTDDLEHLSR